MRADCRGDQVKFRCTCGEILHDQADYLPHKARLVADEDWFDLFNIVDELTTIALPDPDAFTRRTLGLWRDVFQCPACARLYLEARGQLHEFVPADASTHKDLLTGVRTALFTGERWMHFIDTAHRGNRAAWEAELRKEIASGHPLAGMTWRMLARRTDRDEVVLALDSQGYALVHLTWSGSVESPPWPTTKIFSDLHSLVIEVSHHED